MLIIVALKNIFSYSLLFAALNIVFANNLDMKNYALFAFFIIINTFFNFIKAKSKIKNMLYNLVYIIYMLPLLFMRTPNDRMFVAALIITSFLVNTIYLNAEYDNMLAEFNKVMYIDIFLMFLSFITLNIKRFENSSLNYIIIELISGVILLRMTRDRQINGRHKTAVLAPIFIIILASLLCVKNITENIIYFIRISYEKIVDLLFIALYWVMIGIGYFVCLIIEALKNLLTGVRLNMPAEMQNTSIKNIKLHSKSIIENLSGKLFFTLFIKLILTAAVIYIFYKIITGNSYHKSQSGITITREHIKPDINKAKNNRHTSITGSNAPIRRLYLSSVKKAVKYGIGVSKSDTSSDIVDKSSKIFSLKPLNDIRNIYLKARYSDYKADKNDIEMMKERIKKLNKNDRPSDG